MQVLNQSCFEQLLGPAGNLLISPLYQVSLTALANTVKPETAVIEEATAVSIKYNTKEIYIVQIRCYSGKLSRRIITQILCIISQNYIEY